MHNLPKANPRYIISFSGGLGSAISAFIAYENNLKFELVFADTLIEDEDLYRFLKEVAQAVNKTIHWVADGRTPWDVFVDKKYIGNSRTAHCSDVLKREQVRRWMRKNKEIGDILILGMDGSEIDRIDRAQAVWAPTPVKSLLTMYKVHRPAYAGYLKKYDIKEPRLYEMGFPHNNCGGMCVRAGLKQFATLLERFPERYAFHEAEMNRVQGTLREYSTSSFLKTTIEGETIYLSMQEFREAYEKGELTISTYDWGGCDCFTSAD